MKKKSSRSLLLVVVLLVVVLLAGAYLVLKPGSTGGGQANIFGSAPPTVVPQVEVLVPRDDIAKDTMLGVNQEEMFESQTLTGTEAQAVAPNVVKNYREIQGMIPLDLLPRGMQMTRDMFAQASLSFQIPEGKRAFPVEVDRFTGVLGRIVKGDRVDVIFSGRIDTYFMERFPFYTECTASGCSSFSQPSINGHSILGDDPLQLLTVKMTMENIEVLDVITETGADQIAAGKPTPTPKEGTNVSAPLGTAWILIVAVDDQQAEMLRFALDEGFKTQMLLRPRPEASPIPVTTTGITTWVLLTQYGMPFPRAIPHPVAPGELPTGVIPELVPQGR